MRKSFLLTTFPCILCIQFLLISLCEGPEGNIPNIEDTVAENPVENDQTEEDYVFQCENVVQSPLRTFKEGSRPHKVQASLGYLGKPYWPSQWIMTEEILEVEKRIYRPSMKIAEMHSKNFKGENVGVVIIGNSAVNCEHEQIHLRCHAAKTSGYSLYPKKGFFSFGRSKKYQKCSPKSLATAVAGIIGMTDEGPKGGVGIAPKCIIGNIVIEPTNSDGSPENCAHKMNSKGNSVVALIYVHAWQLPQHDYRKGILQHWGQLEYMNFGSKQSEPRPHIMGAGDLGVIANSCQTNEYSSTDSSLLFGSVGYNEFLTPYSETCASLMGVTYSTSNGVEFYNDIVTIPSSDKVLIAHAPKGTTAVSAAIAGGIVALIIDCYRKYHPGKTPSVTDLAFLLAFSADSDILQNKNMLWFENAVGLKYSPQAGFGLPDLVKAFGLIPNWTPLGAPRIYAYSRFDKVIQFMCEAENNTRKSLTNASSMVCHFSIHNAPSNCLIQTVTVEITAKLLKRGSMSAYLISPGGTVSCLLEGRPYDTSRNSYRKLRLRSNHFMGEHVLGRWTIKIFTYKEKSIPTFHPLYSFKTGSPNSSSPPVSPFPLNSDAGSKKSTPTDSSLPTPIIPPAVPLASSQSPPHSPDSDVKKDPVTSSQPASLSETSSTQGQQSLSTTDQASLVSQNSITDQSRPALPTAATTLPKQQLKDNNPHFSSEPPPNPSDQGANTSPAHAKSPDSAANPQNSEHASENGDSSARQTLPPSSNVDTEHGAAPLDSGPAPKSPLQSPSAALPNGEQVPHSPSKLEPAASSNGQPAANLSSKPSPASHTNVSPGRTSKTNSRSYAKKSNVGTMAEVGQIRFRFLLVENLPQSLKLQQKLKTDDRTRFDFELMKVWADFRQYLLVQTDPQNYGTATVDLRDVYGITNIFVQKLLRIQDDVRIKSVASIPADHLRALTAIDDSPQHPTLQHSESLANEGVQPHVLPNQKMQNGEVPPDKQEGERQQPPSSEAQQHD